jgi:hypothetical protein
VDAKLDPKITEEEIEDQARQSDDKSMGSFFKEAGSDPGDSADKLDELMQQVKLTSDQENKLSGAAAAAHNTAKVSRALIQMPRSRRLLRCLTAYPKLRTIWSRPTTRYQTWPKRSVNEARNMPSWGRPNIDAGGEFTRHGIGEPRSGNSAFRQPAFRLPRMRFARG